MSLPVLRSITVADIETIAQLHAESWARAYDGILDARYLGEGLLADRRRVWQATLETPAPRACGWLATVGTEAAGFVYGTFDKDAEFGTHLENLHVHPAMHGRGIGRMLLTQMVQEAAARRRMCNPRAESFSPHVGPPGPARIPVGPAIGMARRLGKPAPRLMIGMRAFVATPPGDFTSPATVLPVQIFLWSDEIDRGFIERTSAAIVVLLIFLLLMNGIAIYLRNRFEKRW